MAEAYKLPKAGSPERGAEVRLLLRPLFVRGVWRNGKRARSSLAAATRAEDSLLTEIVKRSKPVPNGMSIQTPVPWRSVVRFLPHVLAMCVAQRIERQENVFPLV